jgi:hypothetical protein
MEQNVAKRPYLVQVAFPRYQAILNVGYSSPIVKITIIKLRDAFRRDIDMNLATEIRFHLPCSVTCQGSVTWM